MMSINYGLQSLSDSLMTFLPAVYSLKKIQYIRRSLKGGRLCYERLSTGVPVANTKIGWQLESTQKSLLRRV